MKTKEYFYRYNFLEEILSTPSYSECNKNELSSRWNKVYCYMLKKFYRAKATAIDYANKVAYLQFDHQHGIEDERVVSANSRIVELHYPNLKTLLLSTFRKNRLA